MSFKYEGIFERWCLIGGNRALGMWPQEAVSCLACCYSSSFFYWLSPPTRMHWHSDSVRQKKSFCFLSPSIWSKWWHASTHTLSVRTFIAFVWVRQLSLRSSLWIWLEAPRCFCAYYWLPPVHTDHFTDSHQLNVHRGRIQGNGQSRDVFFLLHSLCVICKVSMRL